MEVHLVDTPEGLDSLESDWLRIADGDPDACVFNDWHWNRLWWKHYGDGWRLHVVTVHHLGRIVAIAPMYRCRTRLYGLLPMDTLRFIGTGSDTTPDDLHVLAEPDLRNEAVRLVAAHLLDDAGTRRLELRDLSQGAPLIRELMSRRLRYRFVARRYHHSVRYVMTLPATVTGYDEQISRNSRKHIRRRLKRLHEAGKARFRICRSADDVAQGFEHLVRLHKARWRFKGNDGGFTSREYVGFHRELMQCLLERGELWLLQLELDDTVIGVEYGFVNRNRLCFFQSGFDPAYARLSPGHLMVYHSIEEAIGRGIAQIDFLKGDYDYKRSYANVAVPSVHLELLRLRGLGWLLRLERRLRG